ncbi:hypothetical protein [Sphingomonas sp. PP-F2F-G114-C0414]|nr:hypothetical protein [Sphingomonas sp. PP-F2F-G114-C0414]
MKEPKAPRANAALGGDGVIAGRITSSLHNRSSQTVSRARRERYA